MTASGEDPLPPVNPRLCSSQIVGGRFRRDPPGSTDRYTRWANSLPENRLEVQVLTAHGPTVIMPTWFCSREVFDR